MCFVSPKAAAVCFCGPYVQNPCSFLFLVVGHFSHLISLCLSLQEANLKRAKRGDLKVSVHRMEIERIRYVLSSYLRCRLVKVILACTAQGMKKGDFRSDFYPYKASCFSRALS